MKYCNDCILELKSFRRHGDLSRQESGSCARCPACFEVLPNGKITSLPSATCKTVDRIVIDGETGAEEIQTTLSTDMNIYGNTPTYPLSYNYNVLRFRTERCLNARFNLGSQERPLKFVLQTESKKNVRKYARIRKSKFALCRAQMHAYVPSFTSLVGKLSHQEF